MVFQSLIQMHWLSGRFRKMIGLSLSFLMKKVELFSICFQTWWCQLLIVIPTLLYTHARAAWMELLTTVSKYQEGQHHIWIVFCRFSSVGTEANTLREKMWASQLFSSSVSEKPRLGFKPGQRKKKTCKIVVKIQYQFRCSKGRKVWDVDRTAIEHLVFLKNHPQLKIYYIWS